MRSTPQYNSLQHAWGIENQLRWHELREQAIQDTLKQLQLNPSMKFEAILDILIAHRLKIAELLSAKNLELQFHIKRRRTGLLYTKLIDFGERYEDFLGDLLFIFNESRTKVSLEPPKVYNNRAEYGLRGTRHTVFSTLNIQTTKHHYCKISQINDADATGYSLNWGFIVEYTDPRNIPDLLKICSDLYESIQLSPDNQDKRNVIKELMWHFYQAAFQSRGNASIGEMLTEVILRFHQLSYDLNERFKFPPINLIALFSESVDIFKQRFIINPTEELDIAFSKFLEAGSQTSSHLFKPSEFRLTARKLQLINKGIFDMGIDGDDRKRMQQEPLLTLLRPFHYRADLHSNLKLLPERRQDEPSPCSIL